MTFSEKLIDLRRRRGLSQEQLADRLGVTRQSVSKWESTAAMPEVAKLVALSELFGVSVDYLVKESADAPEPPAELAVTLPADGRRLRRTLDEALGVYSFTSRCRICGLPLVAIRFSHARWPSRSSTAVGIVAIGNFAVGVVSIGLMSVGVFSLGFIALGLLALGAVSLGGLALGATAVGIWAFGASAVGARLAVGAAADGHVAVGVDAEGAHTLLLAGQSAGDVARFLADSGVWPPVAAVARLLLGMFR